MPGRWRAAMVGAALTLVVVTGACTGGPREGEDEQGSDRSRSTLADGSDAGADQGGQEGDAGDPGAADPGPPVVIVPTDEFQRLDPSRFADSYPELFLNDVVATGPGRWLAAAAEEDGRQRTRQPTVVVVDDDRPGGGDRLALPTLGNGPATVSGVAHHGGGVVAVGWDAGPDGGDRALVWAAGDPLDRWTVAALPATSDGRYRAERVVTGPGGRYAIGSVGRDGAIRPTVWRAGEPGWELLTVVDGVRSGLDGPATGTISILDAAPTADGLMAVGVSVAPGRDPRPMVWRELGDRLVEANATGLPDGGSLRGVLVETDGSLLAVGAKTDDGLSAPLVARAAGPGKPWTTWTVELDIGGWISFGGLEFDRVVAAGDGDDPVLYGSLTDPVVQQIFRSDDGGRSWERIGDLATDTGRDAPIRALAVGPEGSLVAVGGLVAQIEHDPAHSDRQPGWWEPLTGPELVPDRTETIAANAVAGGEPGFIVGGVAATRSVSRHRTEAVVWRSPDGSRWERRPVDDTFGYSVDEVFASGRGFGGLKAGGSYFTGAHLIVADGEGEEERWVSSQLPVGEAFLVDSAPGPGGAIVAAGNRPDDEVEFVEPLFVVIEPDGTTREVPLTDSPIPAETNGDVVCLAGQPGAMLAVLSWGDGRTGVAVSPNGERWRGLDRTDGLDHIQVRACGRDATGRFVAAGQNGSGLAAVATSVDGSLWTVTALDDPGIVLGVEAIDGRLILTGAVTAADGRGADGALWAGDGDGWRRLEVSGLESDPFAPAVELTGLAARGEVVVAVGRDRGRAGAWVATRSAIDG